MKKILLILFLSSLSFLAISIPLDSLVEVKVLVIASSGFHKKIGFAVQEDRKGKVKTIDLSVKQYDTFTMKLPMGHYHIDIVEPRVIGNGLKRYTIWINTYFPDAVLVVDRFYKEKRKYKYTSYWVPYYDDVWFLLQQTKTQLRID